MTGITVKSGEGQRVGRRGGGGRGRGGESGEEGKGRPSTGSLPHWSSPLDRPAGPLPWLQSNHTASSSLHPLCLELCPHTPPATQSLSHPQALVHLPLLQGGPRGPRSILSNHPALPHPQGWGRSLATLLWTPDFQALGCSQHQPRAPEGGGCGPHPSGGIRACPGAGSCC